MKVGIAILSGWRVRLLVVATCGLFLAPCASASAQALPAGVTLSVGYYDDEYGANPPPTDWSVTGTSSSSVTFLGGPMNPPGPFGTTWDSGGIRFDNSTAAPIKLDSVFVNIGAKHYNALNELWAPAQLTIPALGVLILASPSGPGPKGLFDSSDYHCGGFPPTGPQDGIIPHIAVTRAGMRTSYADSTQVLTYDCNKLETRNWMAITANVDQRPPAPSIITPRDRSSNNTGSVTLTGSAGASSKVTVYDGSTSQGTTTANGSGSWTQALSRVPDGTHSYTATATDPDTYMTSVPSRTTHVTVNTQAVTSLAMRPAKFRAASGGPSATAARGKIGTTVTFKLTRPGTVRFTVEIRLGGRKVHGRCVAASSHNRHSRVCTRYKRVTGSFTRSGIAGRNNFHFTGRMGGLTLVPGRYRLLATPTTGRGNGNNTPFRIRP